MTSAAPVFSSRFTEALLFAVDVHGAQRRKTSTGLSDGPSYLGHLLGVAALVIEDGGSETEVVAALLHDTLEDTETTDQDLRRLFGAEVEAIIVGCTDSQQTPKPPWRERKEQYLEHLSAASPSVLRVATADKLYNARTILMDLRRHGDESGAGSREADRASFGTTDHFARSWWPAIRARRRTSSLALFPRSRTTRATRRWVGESVRSRDLRPSRSQSKLAG